MADLSRELNRAGVKWGLIGRVALSHYVEAMATADIDILVDGKPLPKLAGFDAASADVIIHGSTGKQVDVLAPQPHSDLPGALTTRALKETVSVEFQGEQVRVVREQWLIALKLFSRIRRQSGWKGKNDEADIEHLLETLGEAWSGRLRSEIVPHLGPEETALLLRLETEVFGPLKESH